MDEDRRSLLRLIYHSSLIAGLCGGCLRIEDRHRGLGFTTFNFSEKDREITFEIEVSASFAYQDRDAEWAAFHDVELVGYSETGERICQEFIGTVTEQQMNGETIKLRCPNYPAVIQYEAVESPCAEDTNIRKAVRREDDGEIIYSIQDRECETTA